LQSIDSRAELAPLSFIHTREFGLYGRFGGPGEARRAIRYCVVRVAGSGFGFEQVLDAFTVTTYGNLFCGERVVLVSHSACVTFALPGVPFEQTLAQELVVVSVNAIGLSQNTVWPLVTVMSVKG
jgi:hypothetical protein